MAKLNDTRIYGDLKVDGEIKNKASTTSEGVVKLNNTISSTSTTEAATANAVKTAYDKANHSHPYASTAVATTSANGLMSSTDKTKLDGIATGANKYTHPTTSGNKHIPSGGSAGQILRWSADGTAAWGADNNTTYSVATTTSNGLMSSTDKSKLDGIATGANKTVLNNTVTSTSSTEAATANAVKTAYDKANHSHPYLPLSGGTMTNNITFSNTLTGIKWTMNTDGASITFKNDSDADADSYLEFQTLDNGNEYFKFTQKTSSATTELMTIKSDGVRVKGNLVYHAGNKPTYSDVGAAASSHTHNYAGSSSAGGAATSAVKLATARTLTIGSTGKTFDGSGNVTWTLAEIGAAASSHTHSYLPLSGGTVTGNLTVSGNIYAPSIGADSSMNMVANNNNEINFGGSNASNTIYMGYRATGSKPIPSTFVFGGSGGSSLLKANRFQSTVTTGTAPFTVASTTVVSDLNVDMVDGKHASDFASSSHTHNYAGSSSAGGSANSAVKLATARTLTIGSTGKTFDGSGNVSWSLSEIGAAASSHTHNNIVSRGKVTAESGITGRPAVTGLSMSEAYNNGYPTPYGNVISLKGTGDGQILVGWAGSDGAHAPVYVRSKRDNTTTANWSGWAQFYTTANKPTYSDVGAAASSHTHNYAGSSSAGGAATSALTCTGNSATATKLQTARTIKIGSTGKTFNGSADVTWTLAEIGAAASSHTHNYAGSSSAGGAATSANKLATARTISLKGSVSGSATFDGSANVSISTSISGGSLIKSGTYRYSEVFNDDSKNRAIGVCCHAEGAMTFAGPGSRIAVIADWDEVGYMFMADDSREGTTTLPSCFKVGATVIMIDEYYSSDCNYVETTITEVINNNTFRVADPTVDDCFYFAIVMDIFGSSNAEDGGCHSEGLGTSAHGASSHAEGYYSVALGEGAHAEGMVTRAYGSASHAGGCGSRSFGSYSRSSGFYTTASTYATHAIGTYNKSSSGSATAYSSTQDAFIIGNGTYSTRSNAFRVTFNGKAYGLSAFSSTGADYAEYFEWEDGNPNNEDRIGKFVTLIGNKIKIATENDFILGVVSGNPAVVGNTSDDSWNEMYLRDKYGRLIYEDVEVVDEKTKETRVEKHIKLNPDYDPSLEYTPRSERQEWNTIGMLGQLIVDDDGTCEVNGYCQCNLNGIATKSETGYRVLKRIDESTILILFK